MPWYFTKLQKQSLGFAVISIKTYRSVRQKEVYCLSLLKPLWNHKEFQTQLENVKVKIRFIQCKHLKAL